MMILNSINSRLGKHIENSKGTGSNDYPRTIEKVVAMLLTFEAGTSKGNNDSPKKNSQNEGTVVASYHLANKQV